MVVGSPFVLPLIWSEVSGVRAQEAGMEEALVL